MEKPCVLLTMFSWIVLATAAGCKPGLLSAGTQDSSSSSSSSNGDTGTSPRSDFGAHTDASFDGKHPWDLAPKPGTDFKPAKDHGQQSNAVRIIFDTDIGGDIDDVGALAILHVMADKGECQILATMTCTGRKKAVGALDAINTYFGRPNIPIGHLDGTINWVEYNRYAEHLSDTWKHDLYGNSAPNATELYRKILAQNPKDSVVIVSVGGLKNLVNLVNSSGDKYSQLNGEDLIAEKVKKVVIMGGGYPNNGGEANFKYSGNCGARDFVAKCKPPIVFSGAEIGSQDYQSGQRLNQLNSSSIVYDAYLYFMKHPPSWATGWKPLPRNDIIDWPTYDQCAVLAAVRGSSHYFNEVSTGHNEIQCNGANSWKNSPDKDQSYLIPDMAPSEVGKLIEKMMLTPP